jgi:hypothetical protein
MTFGCHDGFGACFGRCFEHAFVICGYDAPVSDFHFRDTLPDSGNERRSAEEPKWFLGESNRGEARRNHYQRPHPPPEIARLDAKVTPVNIGNCESRRE